MTLPSLVFGLVISLLIGSLFHLWLGGSPGRLMFYLTLSVAGFAAGQWLANLQNWVLIPIGPLDLGLAIPGSFVFLGFGYWLSRVEIHRPDHSDEV
jgi:hypothetical protein